MNECTSSAHVVEHDQDAALAEAVSERMVAAAPKRELGAGVTRVLDDSRHILRVGHPDDRRGVLVDSSVEETSRLVVARIALRDDVALDLEILHDLHLTPPQSAAVASANSSSVCCAACSRIRRTQSPSAAAPIANAAPTANAAW